MTKEVEIGFAILDVKKGRQALSKHFAARPRTGECPEATEAGIQMERMDDLSFSSVAREDFAKKFAEINRQIDDALAEEGAA